MGDEGGTYWITPVTVEATMKACRQPSPPIRGVSHSPDRMKNWEGVVRYCDNVFFGGDLRC
jgi:hypothetical protein